MNPSRAMWTCNGTTRMEAAVFHGIHQAARQAQGCSRARSAKGPSRICIEFDRQAVASSRPGDVGSHPAGPIPGRVPAREYPRERLPTLATRQDRQAIPGVLPLRREGKGDRPCMDEPDYVQSSGWDHRIPGIAGILARVDHGGPSAVRGLEARPPRRPRPREAATPGSRGTELSFVRNQVDE